MGMKITFKNKIVYLLLQKWKIQIPKKIVKNRFTIWIQEMKIYVYIKISLSQLFSFHSKETRHRISYLNFTFNLVYYSESIKHK